MASAPQPSLPLFYNDLMPINSNDHTKFRMRQAPNANFLKGHHAIPLTTDEFVQAQRFYPIIFSSGEQPLPLALMGLNEGVNTYVGDDGMLTDPVYLPAYVRRYPFMLARLRPDSEELSLCFDPTVETIGEFDEGQMFFAEDGKSPTETTTQILEFCQQFEQSAQRTQSFMEQLAKHDLLMDGEVAIQQQNSDRPFVYRGFRMVNQEKLAELPADVCAEFTKNGMFAIIFAHIFSLDMMRAIFARQIDQGKGPAAQAAAAAPAA